MPEMIGGYVAGPVVIWRSDEVMLSLRQVLAYPTGLEIDVEVQARGFPLGGAKPFGGSGEHKQLVFRLQLPDGTYLVQDDDAGSLDGGGPALTQSFEWTSNGLTGRESARVGLWLWPLPPPGPLNMTFSWRRRSLEDVGFTLDGDAIRDAAERALPFWSGAS